MRPLTLRLKQVPYSTMEIPLRIELDGDLRIISLSYLIIFNPTLPVEPVGNSVMHPIGGFSHWVKLTLLSANVSLSSKDAD